MSFKNYKHNVIRIKKGIPNFNQVYWIIVILNKRKVGSQKMVERLGFYKYGYKRLLSVNFKRLAYYLNRGCILNNTCRQLLYYCVLL
jgi:ribosomal protein S16